MILGTSSVVNDNIQWQWAAITKKNPQKDVLRLLAVFLRSLSVDITALGCVIGYIMVPMVLLEL